MTGAVVVDIPLRWSDMDAQGHVNNVRISELVQESRNQAFYTNGAQEMLDTGIVVVSQDVEFLAPFVVDGSPLRVAVGCSQLGAARTVLIIGPGTTTLRSLVPGELSAPSTSRPVDPVASPMVSVARLSR